MFSKTFSLVCWCLGLVHFLSPLKALLTLCVHLEHPLIKLERVREFSLYTETELPSSSSQNKGVIVSAQPGVEVHLSYVPSTHPQSKPICLLCWLACRRGCLQIGLCLVFWLVEILVSLYTTIGFCCNLNGEYKAGCGASLNAFDLQFLVFQMSG